MKNLTELFLEELADVYSAEQQLIKALPKMAEAANSPELKEAIESHLEETEEHARRIEQVFEVFEEKPYAKKCKAMAGLVAEGEDIIGEDGDPNLKDAGIIAAAQKVEHYEIAAYGTLRTWAALLEKDEAENLLEETLEEERSADEKLTGIAEAINLEAESEGEEGEGEEEEESTSSRGKAKR
jgi:ferritin-like metal-binding protein YciE